MRSRAVFPILVTLLTFAACNYASGQDPKMHAPRTGFEPDADVDRSALDELPPKAKSEPAVASTAEPEPVVDAGGAAPVVAVADAGAPPKTAAPKPAVTAAPAPAACDGKATPCPMQKLMRGTLTAAGSDPKKLAAAFARVAALSPNGGWTWAAISQKGAAAARADDVAGAKAACKECHDAYKEKYKAQYRARAF